MPDCWSQEAKALLTDARDLAVAMGHDWFGTEHLVLAKIKREEVAREGPLVERGVTFEAAEQVVLQLLPTIGMSDADALRAIGIDPLELTKAVKHEQGTVLEISEKPVRRRPVSPEWSIHVTARMQSVLDRAYRECGGRQVETDDIWNALAEEDTGLGLVVLERLGIVLEVREPTRLPRLNGRASHPSGAPPKVTGTSAMTQ